MACPFPVSPTHVAGLGISSLHILARTQLRREPVHSAAPQQPAPVLAVPAYVPNTITAFVMTTTLTRQDIEMGGYTARADIYYKPHINQANIAAVTALLSHYEAGKVQAIGVPAPVSCDRCRTASPYYTCKVAYRRDSTAFVFGKCGSCYHDHKNDQPGDGNNSKGGKVTKPKRGSKKIRKDRKAKGGRSGGAGNSAPAAIAAS
ncbi:hypothetical protein DL95DRAFT_462097 [Leptodontidium sp. 2 PMI_412]|nr:hypothetical protein DL95DRAFT_462097 [Leptodontidium sp. 2 PMI_412]